MDSNFTNQNIRIGHWNANGLEHKANELKNFITRHNIDIMLINETKTSNTYNLKLFGYTCYKKDRPGNHSGGGLLIIINNRIKHNELGVDHNFKTIEVLGIRLKNNTILYSIYLRPKIGNVTNKVDTTELDNLINNNNKVILVGDWNAKHTTWKCKANNGNGKTLFNYVNKKHLTILAPDRYTLYPCNSIQPSIVDFAIVKNINATIETLDELDSDHMPILLNVGDMINTRTEKRYFLDYKNANWPWFREFINKELNINLNIKTRQDVDNSIQNLTEIINKAKDKTIPKQKQQTYQQELPTDILQLIKLRNYYRRQYQRHRLDLYKHEKNRLNNIINYSIKTHFNNKWNKKLENLNVRDNSIWKTAKSFTKKFDNVSSTLHSTNGLVFSDKDKAEALANNFERVHHLTEDDGDKATETKVNKTYIDIKNQNINLDDINLTSPREILKAIKKTQSKKAPGPDGIQNILLKTYQVKHWFKLHTS